MVILCLFTGYERHIFIFVCVLTLSSDFKLEQYEPGSEAFAFFFGLTKGNLNGLLVPKMGNLPCFLMPMLGLTQEGGWGGGRIGTAGIISD